MFVSHSGSLSSVSSSLIRHRRDEVIPTFVKLLKAYSYGVGVTYMLVQFISGNPDIALLSYPDT